MLLVKYETQSTEHNNMMVANFNKWAPLVLQSVRWRRWREELLAMGWELIICIEQRLWLPSGVPRRPTPPTAQCRTSFFCKNPFRINRTIELMDCKHDEGTGLTERFFLILRSTFVSYFCLSHQEGVETHFMVPHLRKWLPFFVSRSVWEQKVTLWGTLFNIQESSKPRLLMSVFSLLYLTRSMTRFLWTGTSIHPMQIFVNPVSVKQMTSYLGRNLGNTEPTV
jgi:hypothetical protein